MPAGFFAFEHGAALLILVRSQSQVFAQVFWQVFAQVFWGKRAEFLAQVPIPVSGWGRRSFALGGVTVM